MILMSRPVTALNAFSLLTGSVSARLVFSMAERSAERLLRLDDVVLGGQGLELRKGYGDRLTLTSRAGLGPGAEIGILAEYRTWRSWYLRSETRERGESYVDFRHEVRFW